MQLATVFLSLTWAVLVQSHFVLQSPPNIGFDDDKENTGPCGSFNPANRTVVTQYPVGGYPLNILTTDNTITLTINTAPANTPNKFTKLAQFKVKGTGTFCIPSVPVTASLAGQDALMQVVGQSSDGTLFQCAAVKFVSGAASKSVPADCANSTGITVTQVTANKTAQRLRV